MQHPIQPKVIAGSIGGGTAAAVVTVALFLVDQIPFVAAWPGTVQGALGVIVVAAVTAAGAWLSGYFAKLTPAQPSQPQ